MSDNLNDNPRCGICGGYTEFMAALGNRDWYRCTACGWEDCHVNDQQARLEFPEAFEEDEHR